MEDSLKQYVEINYPETKSDLFATFILRCLDLCDNDGLTGYMTPFVWMFISSYEKLRNEIITKHFINNLIQLQYSGFDGATVPICTFTLRKQHLENAKGSYIRLSDFKGSQNQAPKTLEAIQNKDCGWFYSTNQNDFNKVPNYSLAYWLKEKELNLYEQKHLLSTFTHPAKGIDTGENLFFLRLWNELKYSDSDFHLASGKWVPYNKGGEYRRWYGNREYLLRWNNGKELLNRITWNKKKPTLRNKSKWFNEGFTWTTISSGNFSARYCEKGALFDNGGCTLFANKNLILFGAFLNSKVASRYLEFLSPTLNFQPGGTGALPISDNFFNGNVDIFRIENIIQLSKQEWNSRETSWDFQQNELIRIKGEDTSATLSTSLQDTYDSYCQYWQNKFFELHKNEEELNRQFIDIYGLQDELTPEVPLEDITILKDETKIEDGQLIFRESEIMAQFISYAVGCMFGRYSLDRPGLILANQGETLENYLKSVTLSAVEVQFLPDDDNVIPILDNEWFEDDIVSRFYTFLKASFGNQYFDKNLAFVEDCVGDIRKYFLRTFYTDHVKRYKKRPIYWMFSSPSGGFNALIYMHRYTPDTLNTLLNGYLKEYQEKLKAQNEQLDHVKNVGTDREKVTAEKEQARINKVLIELQEYDRELFKIATERIAIDLDDGVLVNYNKFGEVIKPVSGLNDKKTKDKVRKFDWIDTSTIQ